MNNSKNARHYRAAVFKKQPGYHGKFLKPSYRKSPFKTGGRAEKNIPEDWIDVYLSRFLS